MIYSGVCLFVHLSWNTGLMGMGVWVCDLFLGGIYFLSLNFKSVYKNSIRDASEMSKKLTY